MPTNFDVIYEDLMEIDPHNAEIISPPDLSNFNDQMKINTLQRFLLRAVRLKHRKNTLIYAYYLGQLIESEPIVAKMAKRCISLHYYLTSIRVYYLFETCPEQIDRTKFMTLNMVRRLKTDAYLSLTSEV